jgi:hypothetical protein
MRRLAVLWASIAAVSNFYAQPIKCYTTPGNIVMSPTHESEPKSINSMKIVRINIHFMLKSDGSGNFDEFTDGDGRYYSGYDYARNHVQMMNSMCNQNPKLNIPTGNTIPALQKNYRFVLDAVYFHRSDATYNFYSCNYTLNGKDKDSVMNVFISHGTGATGGYASDLSTTSHNKYTETTSYWASYVNEWQGLGEPQNWSKAMTTCHELGHLLSLSHTVLWGYGIPCPGGCGGYPGIDAACDDGCADTPTAAEVMATNNCVKHPGYNCGSDQPGCSNNIMDYSSNLALSPCQIGKIHSGLENGLRSYLSCAAVSQDITLCDMGYPKLSYFGKKVSIGTCGTMATITNQEKINVYFSDAVEFSNFEIRTDSELELFFEPTCSF